MTLLVSSHILAELEAYSTDMLVLRQGKIIEQVAIKSATHKQEFKIVLTEASNKLAEILKSLAYVQVLKLEPQHALVQIEGEHAQHHEVLKTLLAHDLSVCEFAKVTSNLQEAYLETIRQRS